ncbi:sensor histidine kinase [Streptomyces sp. NBC_01294]|uniref:sensor histidine kinase n=1 Tax=Streptomyces sp. NBC_01294 TaxID=2903815 RepID=UPI002DDA0AAF|nr:histidine kinase [Streptomyces sp. NBC_01294]WRZ55768.1 histidine kinase [Streptomyces sp. NBC_01294]
MSGWGTAFRRGRGIGPGGAEPGREHTSRSRGESAYAEAEADSDAESDAGPTPAVVSVVLVVVILGFAFEPGVVLPRPAAVPMLLLQLATCLPSTRRLRGAWTLAAQILLTPWSGLPGFLGASVLLIVERPVRWPLFMVVVLAAGPLAPGDGSVHSVLNGIGNALAHGLIIYALTRLTDLYTELRTTRGALAEALVTAERERAGRDLDTVLGTALADIIRLAGQGTRAARDMVAVARAATERVRAAPTARAADGAEIPVGAMTPRLVWPIVVATHVEYLVVGAAFLLGAGLSGLRIAAYGAALATVVGLQAYHSLPRPPGVRPPCVVWTLGVQLALALGVLAAPDGPYPQLVAFAAASVLIVLPGRTAWPAAGMLTALVAIALLVRTDGPGVRGTALLLLDIVVIASVFYGLALLTGLVHQVREAREALASLAVARERRRIARDVHDLLGYGLAAIAMKGELASRDPDRERAERHLADAAALADRALADLRAIPGEGPEFALAEELASARKVLAAAGIAVRVRGETDGAGGPGGASGTVRVDGVDGVDGVDRVDRVDEVAETLFATVLREAVTNVLRHAAGARRCEVVFGPGLLRVADDGRVLPVPPRKDGTGAGGGGNGLRNLRERAAAVGGVLEAGPAPHGRGYVLTVRLDSPSASASPSASVSG